MGDEFKSIIDLLDAFFGASWTPDSVDQLTPQELDALAADVDDFYAGYKVPALKADLLRSYSGGATFTANMKVGVDPESHPKFVPNSQLLPFAHAAALYVDQIIVNCPLDSWIFSYRDFLAPDPFRGHNGLQIQPMSAGEVYGSGHKNAAEEESRVQIKDALSRLSVLAPAIRQGWIVTVPHLRIWKSAKESIRTQVRRDAMNLSLVDVLSSTFEIPPAQSDNIRGLNVAPSGGVIPKDHARSIVESSMIYFNSTLAVAGVTESRFLPTADSDFSLLRQRVQDAGKLNRAIRDGLAVGSLRRAFLPTFDDATFENICEIRQSEESFSNWRNEIRALADGTSPISAHELKEYESILDEKISRHVSKIESDIENSRSLRGKISAARPSKLDIGLAATVWAIPPQGSVLKLVAGLSAPILKAAVNSIVARRASSSSVLMKLQRRNS